MPLRQMAFFVDRIAQRKSGCLLFLYGTSLPCLCIILPQLTLNIISPCYLRVKENPHPVRRRAGVNIVADRTSVLSNEPFLPASRTPKSVYIFYGKRRRRNASKPVFFQSVSGHRSKSLSQRKPLRRSSQRIRGPFRRNVNPSAQRSGRSHRAPHLLLTGRLPIFGFRQIMKNAKSLCCYIGSINHFFA